MEMIICLMGHLSVVGDHENLGISEKTQIPDLKRRHKKSKIQSFIGFECEMTCRVHIDEKELWRKFRCQRIFLLAWQLQRKFC
jgi:hypothetical protein